MARTMTDEQEFGIRAVLDHAPAHVNVNAKRLLAELDAERAAHANTSGTLALLVSELVEACGWGDKTPLHAALHARNAVLNLKADVAAERAAHAETKADAEGWRNGQAQVQRDFDLLYADTQALKARLAATHKECNITNEELCRDITALKARLALAEAVCESCYQGDGTRNDPDCFSWDALAAWRAAK